MTVQMPRIVQRPSPNYSPTPIQHDLLILHMMEGGYEGSVAWLCQQRAGASAHLCMSEDGSEVSQLVPLSMKAWAQVAGNSRGISLEIPGRTADGIPTTRWEAAAKIIAWLSKAYEIPVVWAKGTLGRGLCQHHDGGDAWGDHVDCSPVGSEIWLAFIEMVATFRLELDQGPLPDFALHGLPNPRQVQLPPNVPATPSHNGASRIDQDSIGDRHPTRSGYPHGSVSDMQWRLNTAGATPKLTIDGDAGHGDSLTRLALKSFQRSHGLTPDGLIGPLTWTALDAASI